MPAPPRVPDPALRARRGVARNGLLAVALGLVVAGLVWRRAAAAPAGEVRTREALCYVPDAALLERIAADLRSDRLASLAGLERVAAEPARRLELFLFHDDGGLTLANHGDSLALVVEADGAAGGTGRWCHLRRPEQGRPLEEELVGEPSALGSAAEEGSGPGTRLVRMLGAHAPERALLERLRAADEPTRLVPRVLLAVESEAWSFRPGGGGEELVVRLARLGATWWTPGTPVALDALADLRAVATAPLARSWCELVLERPSSGDAPPRPLALPSELRRTSGLAETARCEARYLRAVRSLCE